MTRTDLHSDAALLLDALNLATTAFAQYALGIDDPPSYLVADFVDGFLQDAELRRVAAVKARETTQ